MDNVTKGSKKTIGIMVVILAAIIISFRGYSLIQIFLSKDNYYYEPGELYLLYFEELLVIITLITVIIAVAKNHRKIAMFALAIQYAIAVALNIIESDNDNIKLLPIVCVIIISVTLFLCALKKK